MTLRPSLVALLLVCATGCPSDRATTARPHTPDSSRVMAQVPPAQPSAARPASRDSVVPTDSSEAGALAASQGSAVRRGDTLFLRLASGATLPLVNTPQVGDMVATYRYRGTLVGGLYYIVDVQWYESGAKVLVDAETGGQETIVGDPTMSPSDSLAVASAFSLDIGEGANEIQIWRLLPHPPQLAWRFETPGDRVGAWGAWRPVWRGDTLVEMIREIRLPGPQDSTFSSPTRREPMRLVRAGAEWRVDTLAR